LEDEFKIKNYFDAEFKKLSFTKDDVLYFLNNHSCIKYTSENISNYIKLVDFFDYAIKNIFMQHVSHILKYICESDIVLNFDNFDNYRATKIKQMDDDYEKLKMLFKIKNTKIQTQISKKINLNNNLLKKLHINELNLNVSHIITTNEIMKLQLYTLKINGRYISIEHIDKQNLHTLHISGYTDIKDIHLKSVTNLKVLNIKEEKNIIDHGIINLPLIELYANNNITNDGIKNMYLLRILDVSDCYKITDEGIIHKNLRVLYAGFKLINETLKKLNLNILYVNDKMSDKDIMHMTNLHTLGIRNNNKFSEKCLKYMNFKYETTIYTKTNEYSIYKRKIFYI
jgi:hypothetical protein